MFVSLCCCYCWLLAPFSKSLGKSHLQLKAAQHGEEDEGEAEEANRHANQALEQQPLPGRVVELLGVGHRANAFHTLQGGHFMSLKDSAAPTSDKNSYLKNKTRTKQQSHTHTHTDPELRSGLLN